MGEGPIGDEDGGPAGEDEFEGEDGAVFGPQAPEDGLDGEEVFRQPEDGGGAGDGWWAWGEVLGLFGWEEDKLQDKGEEESEEEDDEGP